MPALPWLLLLVFLCGCSAPVEPSGCIGEAPEQLGDACGGDGECGNWLQCVDGGCSLPPAVSGDGGETITLTGGAEPVELQIERAVSDRERERGLGYRPCIEDGWGLLIEFPQPGDHLIETDTMRFGLDIAMAGPDGVVHEVHYGAPAGGKALYGASEPVSLVLETPAGAAGVEVGQTIER